MLKRSRLPLGTVPHYHHRQILARSNVKPSVWRGQLYTLARLEILRIAPTHISICTLSPGANSSSSIHRWQVHVASFSMLANVLVAERLVLC